MTPISEKDTIFEQTSKRTIESSSRLGSLKQTPEEQKRTQMSSSGFADDSRKLTGTGKYNFKD